MHACVYGPPPSSFDAQSNENAVLYGPPEEIQTYDDTSKESTTTATKKQGSFDPKDNQNEDVYGPPEWFDGEADDSDSFDPKDNQNEDVYGPPPEDDPVELDEDSSQEPEDSFDPADNQNVCVYGPPEMLNGSTPDSRRFLGFGDLSGIKPPEEGK